jgi:hypothetical protein
VGRGDDAQAGRAARCAARDSGGAPEVEEDDAEEEDGEEEPQRSGQVGEEVGRVPGAYGGGPVAWRGRGRRQVGRWRILGGRRWHRILWGRGLGRGGRQRSGRMTAAEGEDTTSTMAADQGRKSGQVLEGESRCFYI